MARELVEVMTKPVSANSIAIMYPIATPFSSLVSAVHYKTLEARIARDIWPLHSGEGWVRTLQGIYGEKCCELHCILEASDWVPSEKIVVWFANAIDSDTATCSDAIVDYCTGGMPDVGGYAPMIWQYHGDPDYDISPYAGGPIDLQWNPTTSPGYCSTSYKLVTQCSDTCFAAYCS